MTLIGFLVNPIAGMGGRVGLKGTDGVVERAIELGAKPVASHKANEMLSELKRLLEKTREKPEFKWLTCSGEMGTYPLEKAGFNDYKVVYEPGSQTANEDTTAATNKFIEQEVDLVLFCGGDGTARDICGITKKTVPILGIPSGVKMHSGVFGVSPAKTAEILTDFLEDRLTLTEVEILDLDEDRYRNGEWAVRLYDTALTPYESTLTQASKMMVNEISEDELKEEIAEYITEEITEKPDTLFLLGPGSTVDFVGKELKIDKTLLGIDAVAGAELVGKDLNEAGILALMKRYQNFRLVLSPIGAQGFVLGRGNLQLSPAVIRKIGRKNIMIICTPAKLQRTPVIRFDTGDISLNKKLYGKGYLAVIIGYRLSRLVDVAI